MRRHIAMIAATALATLLLALPARAQSPGPPPPGGPGMGSHHGGPGGGPGRGGDGFQQQLMEHLYPVHLVRAHAHDLDLSDAQIDKLRKVTVDVNAEIERLTWDVQREAGKLLDLVEQGASKEQVYAQMDNVFKYENKIKKKKLGLMIVVRDILSKQQRAVLDKVKEEHRFPGRGAPGAAKGRRGKKMAGKGHPAPF